MQIVNQLKIKATPVFYANKKAYEDGYPIICNEGGSRSSKSYSVVQLLIRFNHRSMNSTTESIPDQIYPVTYLTL